MVIKVYTEFSCLKIVKTSFFSFGLGLGGCDVRKNTVVEVQFGEQAELLQQTMVHSRWEKELVKKQSV